MNPVVMSLGPGSIRISAMAGSIPIVGDFTQATAVTCCQLLLRRSRGFLKADHVDIWEEVLCGQAKHRFIDNSWSMMAN